MRGYGNVIAKSVVVALWILSMAASAQEQAAPHTPAANAEEEATVVSSVSETEAAQVAHVREEVSAGILAVIESDSERSTGNEAQKTVRSLKDAEHGGATAPSTFVPDGQSKIQTRGSSADQATTQKSAVPSVAASSSVATPKILRANCGPILLQQVFAEHEIHTTVEELIEQTNTRLGLTTLYDMKRTVLEHGLHAQGIKTGVDTLARLIEVGDVICHFTENNHYIWLQSIGDRELELVDPAWTSQDSQVQTMWRHVFDQEWKGICLVISDQRIDFSKILGSAKAQGGIR